MNLTKQQIVGKINNILGGKYITEYNKVKRRLLLIYLEELEYINSVLLPNDLEKRKQLIYTSKGGFFQAEFIKINGELRKMNCRFEVQKDRHGGELRYVPSDKSLFPVWDRNAKGNKYKMLPLDRIERLKINNQVYLFDKQDKLKSIYNQEKEN